MFDIYSYTSQRHPFHLISPSPWPFLGSFAALFLTFSMVLMMHRFKGGLAFYGVALFWVCWIMLLWWLDVIYEATYSGHHTLKVQKGLRYGMVLFILSEVMFFFGFFWAFFTSSLCPTLEIGGVWPPVDLTPLDPFGVPLLNTLILLFSGVSVSIAHEAIINGKTAVAFFWLVFTVTLAIFFTFYQVMEYLEASFGMTDSVYGSTFYMATGFHGFHVIIGTIFLICCTYRLYNHEFTRDHHFGFEAAAWYWHFVDVVWLFLFITIYWWGSS